MASHDQGKLSRHLLLGVGLRITVAVFGIAVFGIAVFGIAVFGIAVFGIAVFGIANADDKTKKQSSESENKAEPNDKKETAVLPKAFIDGTGQGWKKLGEKDFEHVNCDKDTWTWKGVLLQCTGRPVGVIKSVKQYTNFELVAQWKHKKKAGNSGIFVWATEKSLKALKKPGLPSGIEVQVLDIGYAEQYEKNHKKKPDWFTSHGDVFPVGVKMKPFPPVSPNGKRSFPSKNLVKGVNQWNHYYVRAINGEVRLWVNGEEVSGGTKCDPKSGFLCLESEGSPIEFKNLRIRELP